MELSDPSVWRLPERQATERDEQAIQHWVAHEWPRIKKRNRRIGLACLRRGGRLANPGVADLVAVRPDADPAPPPGAVGAGPDATLECLRRLDDQPGRIQEVLYALERLAGGTKGGEPS